MTPDPGSVFGNLLGGCISDEYIHEDKTGAKESFLFLLMGVCSSIATTYLLSVAGILL
jgi:hypothetical protein